MEGSLESEVGTDPKVLDRLGFQVGRRLASSARQRMTRWPVPLELDSPLTGLRTEGCALLPRMFSPASLADLVEVAVRVDADDDVPHFIEEAGCDQIVGTRRDDVAPDDRAVLDRYWLHPTVIALLSAAGRRQVDPADLRCTIQRLVHHDDGVVHGPLIRSDVAHPTHAMWLHLSDVSEQDGPLVYYPGSQRLTPRQLRGVYAGSVSGRAPTRVVTDDEIAARKLEPRLFACARGTAVLANTFGYHGWFPGNGGGDRLVLHVEVARDGQPVTA